MPAGRQKHNSRQGTDRGRSPSQKENKLQAIKAAKRVTDSSRPSVESQRRVQRPLALQQQQLEVAIPPADEPATSQPHGRSSDSLTLRKHMQAAKAELQPRLHEVHQRNLQRVQSGSPTPACTALDHACSPTNHNSRHASPQLDSAAFRGFVEEVAARIIQAYWRKLQANKTAFPSELLVPRSPPPVPHSVSSEQAPFELAEEGSDQHVTGRDLSSRSSLDNIEALMNRYRKDRSQARTSQRSDQDAVQHAVSILRAAGMKVAEDGEGPTNSITEQVVDEATTPRSMHRDKPAGNANQSSDVQGDHLCISPQNKNVQQGQNLSIADVVHEAAIRPRSDCQGVRPGARSVNVRERISDIRAGHGAEVLSGYTEMTSQCVENLHMPVSPQCLRQEIANDQILVVESTAVEEPDRKLSNILDYLDSVSHQADEEAELVMETRSKSTCGSTAPASTQHRAPYSIQTLVDHQAAKTADDLSIAHVLDTALSERDLDTVLPRVGVSSQPREQLPGVSFCEEVRRRVKKMQQELQAREQAVASLNTQITSLKCAHSEECKLLKQGHDAALAAQKDESEAALKRHLDLIDRLLADKDALSKQVDVAKDQLESLEEKHASTVSAMKAGWAQELRKQKDNWTATEKSKREGWLADKTKEIKDATIKGLEPEIQALVQKHRTEIGDIKESLKLETKRQMDTMRDQHEAYVRQLRERMLHDREVAVEGERAGAQKRLSDAAERYEASAQQARMHLVADHERRLGEAEDAWRMQRRELMDRVKQLEQLHQDLEAEKSAAGLKAREEERQKHNTAVKSLKEGYDAENQAWRRAIADKARKQLADKESQLRRTLEAERDQQIELVIKKFDGEMAEKAQKLMEKHSSELADLKSEHEIALSEVLGSQQRYSERHREASTALQAAKNRADAAQDQVKYLKDTITDQEAKLKRIEQQLQCSDEETEKKLQDQQLRLSAQHAAEMVNLQSTKAELAQARERLTQASNENLMLKQRQVDEMDRVECRVKAAIQRKDETIASLRSQLAELNEQMRNAESILSLE